MRKALLFLIVMFFGLAGASSAQAPEEIYAEANLSYENGDYAKAISLYETLVRMDRVSPEVFYNLGNSFFKSKKIGMAIANYERALRLAPRDRDARLNLKLAREMAVDKINISDRGFILNAAFFLYDRMSIEELTAACFVFYLATALLLIFFIFFVSKRRIIFYNVWVTGFMSLVFLVFLAAKIQGENAAMKAVIVSEKIDVRSGPKDDYLLQFTLHEGTEVRVVKESQGWYEIDLSKDLRGWLPKAGVEII
ncbi:MAG: tetratricopeptide repeat protein [Candidatus Omnitrophota bacterium]